MALRSEWVKCGKKCGGCPHGPYWYRYWREGKRVKKEYLGKGDPWAKAGEREAPAAHRWDAIFSERTANTRLACEILEIREAAGKEEAAAGFRRKSMECHPDRGGDARRQMHVNAAWSYLRKVRSW